MSDENLSPQPSPPQGEREPDAPKWGDPISSIPAERQEELTQLAEAQRAWLAGPAVGGPSPDREPKESPFAKATGEDVESLTGAEVFFLAAEAFAAEWGIALDEAEQQVRRGRYLSLSYAHLEGADLNGAHLAGARLKYAHLEGAFLGAAQLAGADLRFAHLEGANLYGAHLAGARLGAAHLAGACLTMAHLEGAELYAAHLEGADLRGAFFSTATDLASAALADEQHGAARVADVRWQDANLAVIRQWRHVEMLGDERAARELAKQPLPKGASRADRKQAREDRRGELLEAWQDAARANRQLASVMRAQGMSDEADRFAYRGQVCQRQVYRYDRQPVRRGFSRLLDLIAGYGYKPERSLIAYLLIILGFALAFHFVGPLEGHPFHYDGALIFSVTSFHGRGFFPGGLNLENWITRLAALEAILGLLIEISFIATFTQRFFGR